VTERLDVAVIGGGPAGALVAARLAAAGRSVVVFERAPSWRWRAGGVFASPAAMTGLREAGVGEPLLGIVARPIPAMGVVTSAGSAFRLTYGAEDTGATAVGFDRSALDPGLLDHAATAGAEIRRGWTVIGADPTTGAVRVRQPDGARLSVSARVVVGADGPGSVVARATGVHRPVRLPPRIGLSWHVTDGTPDVTRTTDTDGEARMHVIDDGYVGIAPVPGARRNIGVVLGRSWASSLRRDGAPAVTARILAAIPPPGGGAARWCDRPALDTIEGAWPLGGRVTRRSGHRWLLVGDAAGFLDPFTGEGIHRAIVSADLGARAILAQGRGRADAFAAYDRAMTRRFATKDAVSRLVQAFLARPGLFDYAARRVAARPAVRATMGLVMGDLIPAGNALDPRYLAALLAP